FSAPASPQFPSNYVGKYFYAALTGQWIRVFDPSHPGSASDPDTSQPFATGLPGQARDLAVDAAGSLYYLSGDGLIDKISYKAVAVAATPINLASAFNATGLVADGGKFGGGGLDHDGYALSSSLVGRSLTVGGTKFDLGPAGAKDIVSAAGQTIALPAGRYSALKLLATGVNGAQANQVFTVTYTDGTTARFVQSISDWAMPRNYSGEATALATAYRDTAVGG